MTGSVIFFLYVQARAFIALATYVLEQNGETPSGLPSHAAALGDLKSALRNTELAGERDGGEVEDGRAGRGRYSQKQWAFAGSLLSDKSSRT